MLHKSPVKFLDVLIVCCLLAALLIVGSIWDYPISLVLHDEGNWFGNLFAAYGELPAMAGLLLAGLILILARNKDKKGVAVPQVIVGCLLMLLGAATNLVMPMAYLPINIFVILGIGAMLCAAVIILAVRLCKTADRAALIKVAAILVSVILTEMILINIIKVPWERPRMRLIAVEQDAGFVPWWVIGGDLREQLMAAGVEGDEFKSFPSGHTANGACAVMLTLFALVSEKLKDKRTLLFGVGTVWGLLVALSRIIMGAHFLTDTIMGFAVTLLVFLIVSKLVLSKKKKA